MTRIPEVVDDFIRNFCMQMGLQRTQEAFDDEWYELKSAGLLKESDAVMPDVYKQNQVGYMADGIQG